MSENFEKFKPEPQLEPVSETEKSEPTIEEELSLEAIERIMCEVKDINEKGNAISCINAREDTFTPSGLIKLESVLKYGLVGTNEKQKGHVSGHFQNETNRSEYVNTIRNKEKPDVFFNIVGRAWLPGHPAKIRHLYPFMEGDIDAIVIMFDLSQYRENPTKKRDSLKNKTFSPNLEDVYDETVCPTPDLGFRLSPRVAPRSFTGIIFSLGKLTKNYKMNEGEAAQMLAKKMLKSEGDNKKLIPIYDGEGNLWWPKQMNYEEVKKFVVERENQKMGKE